MALMTGAGYRQSLRERKNLKVYVMGELIEGAAVIDHPMIRGHVNSAAMTYELAEDPRHEDLMLAVSHLTGETINRFTHIHQSTEDLVKKVQMLRMISQRTGTCYQRCVGLDASNAVYSVTYEIDRAKGTDYHQRYLRFLKQWQREDWMVAGAMTDPKGDRSLKPSQQPDPDMYVHVVARDVDGVDANGAPCRGIVVRGCKMHMTGMVNSHYMLLMPTSSFGPEDHDYCVVCAIPVDAPNVIHIFGRQTNDGRKLEGEIDQGNARFGVVGGECMTVLDDVFVPWENVFMCGEHEFSGMLVERFACYHRQNYGGCKAGVSDIVIGAAATLADMGGYAKAAHIKDKLNQMMHLNETLFCCAVACSAMGHPLPCGCYFVDPLMANVDKHNVTNFIYEIDRLAQDIGGGLLATIPSQRDLEHPEIGKYVRKYLHGAEGYTTEDRIRMVRLLEVMTGGVALVESMHGAGSPQAQKVMYSKLCNLTAKKQAAQRIAGVSFAET